MAPENGWTAARPFVSVVIPTYNQASFLREAIDSVLAQTYPERECIVVDDGSTDATPEVIASYGSQIVAIRQENRGAASALNLGIRSARGDLVSWLSSDDSYLPAKLERQVTAVSGRTDVGLCCTGWEATDGSGVVTRRYDEPTWIHPDPFVSVFWRNPINGTTVMIPRSVLDEVGLFDERLRADVDGEMWLRILARRTVVTVPGVLARYRVHEAAMSRNRSLMVESKTRVRLARMDTLVERVRGADDRDAPRVLAVIGSDMLRQGLRPVARALLVASVRAGRAPEAQAELARSLVASTSAGQRAGALASGASAAFSRLRSVAGPRLRLGPRRVVARIPGARRAVRALRQRG